MLSYDYQHMDADRDRAVQVLTPSYKKQYVKTFDLLTQGPVEVKVAEEVA